MTGDGCRQLTEEPLAALVALLLRATVAVENLGPSQLLRSPRTPSRATVAIHADLRRRAAGMINKQESAIPLPAIHLLKLSCEGTLAVLLLKSLVWMVTVELPPLGYRLGVDAAPTSQHSQALLTMLYRSTDRRCRGGAPV